MTDIPARAILDADPFATERAKAAAEIAAEFERLLQRGVPVTDRDKTRALAAISLRLLSQRGGLQ